VNKDDLLEYGDLKQCDCPRSALVGVGQLPNVAWHLIPARIAAAKPNCDTTWPPQMNLKRGMGRLKE
jgi:hypothetical protein